MKTYVMGSHLNSLSEVTGMSTTMYVFVEKLEKYYIFWLKKVLYRAVLKLPDMYM